MTIGILRSRHSDKLNIDKQGFNSKNEKIPERKKRKREISIVYVATEFSMSRQTSKKIAKELCQDNISYVATQKYEY